MHWFLNDRDDTRSSFYLEDAATEFQVQGLELDWVCVAWDADFRFAHDRLELSLFRREQMANDEEGRSPKLLAQRISCAATRARQGMVIFVPHGELSRPDPRAAVLRRDVRLFEGNGRHRHLEGSNCSAMPVPDRLKVPRGTRIQLDAPMPS